MAIITGCFSFVSYVGYLGHTTDTLQLAATAVYPARIPHYGRASLTNANGLTIRRVKPRVAPTTTFCHHTTIPPLVSPTED